MYITILIYLNSYGSRTVYYHYDILFFFYSVYHNTDIIFHLTTKIVYHNSDIRFFLHFSPIFLKSAVPLVRRFFFYSLLLWDDSITRFWLWDNPVPTVSLSIPLYLTLSVVIRFCNIQFWLGISLLSPFCTPFVSLTVLVIKPY